MAADPVQKVKNLIQLAVAAGEAEARTAAFMAVQLICKYKLRLVYPPGGKPVKEAQPPAGPRTRAELSDVAMRRCSTLLVLLKGRAKGGVYPSYSVPEIVAMDMVQKVIFEGERKVYFAVLRKELQRLVGEGMLTSSTKGYRWPA